MRLHTWTVALLLCALTAQAHAFSTPKPGQVIEVSLEQLHPTQAVVGFDQIYYSLGLFADKPAKVFDEYCETNGQGAADNVPKRPTCSSRRASPARTRWARIPRT